jgi:hypothetical protein
MKLTIVLVTLGITLLFTGIIRMNLIKLDRDFLINNIPLLGAFLILGFLNYKLIDGTRSVTEGLKIGGIMAARFAPMLLCMFITMGAAMVLINHYRDSIVPYLAGRSGLFGAWLSSFVMPGSLTSVPIVRELWISNPESRFGLLLFLGISPLVGWQVLLIRQPMLGWRITILMFAFNVCASLIIFASTWTAMKIFKI